MDTASFQEHDHNEILESNAAGSEASAPADSASRHSATLSGQDDSARKEPANEHPDNLNPEGHPSSEREAFDEAIQRVLSSSGGELLFRIPSPPAGGEEIAAVRLGQGEARLLALVILPQGAPLRVEPVEDSANPLAPIVQSYATLADAWKTAA